MKDLKLKVGDKCYIGREEFVCCSVSKRLNVDYPYWIEKGLNLMTITRDGRILTDSPPIVSLEPYDFPEMAYEKPLEIGKPHYFWNFLNYVEYGVLLRINNNSEDSWRYESFNDYFEFCSPTPPELPIK